MQIASTSRSAAAKQGFDGAFHSDADGTRRVLNLSERNGRVTGTMGSAAIDAQVDGTLARGNLKDPVSAASLGMIEMSLQGEQLILAITVLNPNSEQGHDLPPITFLRGTPPPVSVQFDAQVSGRWRHALPADSSGAATGDLWLILHPDGSLQHGRTFAQTSAANEARLTAGMISGGEDGFSGRWRTSNRILHVLPLGSSQWIDFARYDVNSEQLILTYNNGSRQTYQKQ